MARLCIRVTANDHPTNAALTPLRMRPGDVVEIKPDGWEWCKGELNCGQYRFIDVPGVAEGDLVHLKTPRYSGSTMTRIRNQCLDTAELNKVAWVGKSTATKAEVDAVTITRT